jgi:ABC-type lipoprotein export system ATPase subunit
MSSLELATASLATCSGVSVMYGTGDARVAALTGVTLTLRPGEALALRGPSGSGKTTLLHVLGGLTTPTAGSVEWRGKPLSTLDAAARGRARAGAIAYVFQGGGLLPHFTARENVAFAALVGRGARPERRAPEDLLALVGLERKLDALPSELSGGEAQRVAVARALAQGAELVLCDEPTGQLDSATGGRVLDLLDSLQAELAFALVAATHEAGVARRFPRVVELLDGRIVGTSSRWDSARASG